MRPLLQYSKGGLIAAAILGLPAVVMIMEEGVIAIGALLGAIALAIRSFMPPVGWGRGIFVYVGGSLAGMVLFLLTIIDSDEAARLIVPVLMSGLCLWTGFKKGKIQRRIPRHGPRAGTNADT